LGLRILRSTVGPWQLGQQGWKSRGSRACSAKGSDDSGKSASTRRVFQASAFRTRNFIEAARAIAMPQYTNTLESSPRWNSKNGSMHPYKAGFLPFSILSIFHEPLLTVSGEFAQVEDLLAIRLIAWQVGKMPKRPGKTKKTIAAPKTGNIGNASVPSHKASHEQRRDWNTKAILNKFQGRKSI
jgi:hypothetical protein